MPTFSASLDVERGRDRVAARAADAIIRANGPTSKSETLRELVRDDEGGRPLAEIWPSRRPPNAEMD